MSNVSLQLTGAWAHHYGSAFLIATGQRYPYIGATARS